MIIGFMALSLLGNALELLNNYGFFDVLLPMLLIFTIFYAILAKTGILGDSEKSHVKIINSIVSIAAGFLFVTQTDLVKILNNIVPRASLLLVMSLLVLMLLAFTGLFKTEWITNKSKWTWVFGILIVLIFLGILDVSGVYIPGIHQIVALLYGTGGVGKISVSSETIEIALGVLLFLVLPIVVIVFMVKSTGSGSG